MNASFAAMVISLQVGLPQRRISTDVSAYSGAQQEWTTGFFKESTAESIWLGALNLAGDGQADLDNHGGLDKAVNVYPHEHYPYWAQTVGLTNLPMGGFGENFTTQGVLEEQVCIGDIFQIGDATVQISQPRQPCWKLARYWGIKDLALHVQESGRTGWYFRVLKEGHVQARKNLVLLERPYPNWTVLAANEVMHHQVHDRQAAKNLADCDALSSRWREKLRRRALTGVPENTSLRLRGPGK
ncbi:MAG TPA: MOSC domain-containing protein [Nitrospira sp.]|nr:MOSC domain-containing protein [Nitrospira sp.]